MSCRPEGRQLFAFVTDERILHYFAPDSEQQLHDHGVVWSLEV